MTLASPQYFPGCFPLAILEDYHFFLFSVVISFYLVSVTWEPSVFPKRVVFLARILFQSCWRYSNFFFFFSLCKSHLPSFLSCLRLYCFPHLLSSMLNIMDLCFLLQLGLKPLLLFVPSLYFTVLLFKHLSIVLEDIRKNRRRYDNTEKR